MNTARLYLFSLLIAAVAILAGCSEDPPTQSQFIGAIKGKVTDANTGKPLSGVNISTTPATQSVTTDEKGNYSVPSLLAGQYTVTAQKAGYVSKSVEIVVTSTTVTADIALGTVPPNFPPTAPENPTPADGATNQPRSLTFRWASTDPEGDAIRYNVYLGTSNPPTTAIAMNRTSASLLRAGLQSGTTYYWRVVAKSGADSTVGPVWSFTTSTITASSDLVAHYPFNGNADDESGNGHDGIVEGATLTADRSGAQEGAYLFDGNDRISVAHHSTLNFPGGGSFTIGAWVKFTDTQTDYAGIIAKGPDGTAHPGYMLVILNGNTPAFSIGDPGDITRASTIPINDGDWHFLTVTFDGPARTARLYVDGELVAQQSDPTIGANFKTTAPLVIGTERNNERFFNGAIDDVWIFNRALSVTEIQDLYLQ